MLSIWKFELTDISQDKPEELGRTKVSLPWGAKVLSVGGQGLKVVVWVEVNPSHRPDENRHFRILGTGWDFEEHPEFKRKFIGTAVTGGGQYFFHVFEELPNGNH